MRCFLTTPVLAMTLLPLMSFHSPNQADDPPLPPPMPIEYPIRPIYPILPLIPALESAPVLTAQVLKMKVTACSPQDPQDIEYYKANGYAGAVHNIAANLKRFPKGTLMRVPGYMKSQPGKFWEVDSAGGSIIRRSARQGVVQIDVKFERYTTAINWGSQLLDVEVITPAAYQKWQSSYNAWEKKRDRYLQVIETRKSILSNYEFQCKRWDSECAVIRKINYGL